MEILVAILAIAIVLLLVLLVLQRRQSDPHAVQDALGKASEQLLALANERFARQAESSQADLEGKKRLIDQQLEQMNASLERVNTLVSTAEKERIAKFSELSVQLKSVGEQAASLTASTNTLRQALTSTKSRGQWGERMAEDVLRLVGLAEGVNYLKQATVDGASGRPDFVFLLPGGLKLNMDVKFPLSNYLRLLEVDSEMERSTYRDAFLRDVRARFKEITTREYVDPEGGTVDYVLLFIPNEAIYAFIHENDPGVLDAGLRSKVVCCSPLTLFAVLAVIRQAVESFALQKASEEIVSLFGRFYAEWGKFTDALELVGRRIQSTQRAFDDLNGPRRRQLQRPLDRIDALRQQRGLPIAPVDAAIPGDQLAMLPGGDGDQEDD